MPAMNAPQSVADQLRDAIRNSGLSMREIARQADLSAPVVSKFMSGKDITLSTATAIAQALGQRLKL